MSSSVNNNANEQHAGESCCIQRLLLVHLTLEEIATGKSFDECASEQELGEQILYFYSSSTSSSSPHEDPHQKDNNLAEAIRFVGICSALYTLPTVIDCCSETQQEDRTTEVFLDHCTLVFEALEGNPSILLVAQVGRQKNSPKGATPASVAAALRRTHLLFTLLRGGGIHERLLLQTTAGPQQLVGIPPPPPPLEEEKTSLHPSSTCLYPGMDQLYSLRKQARKIRERSRRRSQSAIHDNDDGSPAAAAADLSSSSELQLVEDSIVALLESLPIGSLRKDLVVHYDAFLEEFNTLARLNLGAACSIVECLPTPIPLQLLSRSSNAVTQQSALEYGPFVIASSVLTILNTVMKGYLDQGGKEPSSPWSQILSMSLFVRGQLAWSEHSPAFHRTMEISNETSCLLMWYMASMRQKMNSGNKNNASGSLSSSSSLQTSSLNTKLKRSLRPFGLSFGDHPPDIADAVSSDADDAPVPSISKEGKGFLPPPSLSMLSVADELNSFRGPLGEKRLVWAPPAHLPIRVQQQQQNVGSHSVRSRICLYDHGDLSFLLFLDSARDNDDAVYQALLTAFAKAVDRAITLALPENKLGHPVRVECSTWKEPGQDIIFVDRQTLRVVIHASTAGHKTSSSSKPSVAATRKKYGHQTIDTHCNNLTDIGASSLPGFDCRHYLASHFRLDTLLAFADAMNEIAQHGRTNSESNNDGGVFEMCSSLPQGWMLAMALGERELYVLFDSSLYVTINDVQNAAARIRNEFLHGAI